jgi:hypothetical protein
MIQRGLLVAVLLAGFAGCAPAVDGEDVDVGQAAVDGSVFVPVPSMTEEERKTILAKYESVQHAGVRQELFEEAVLYYDTNLSHIPNKQYLTVLDFKAHSGKRRFFVMDMVGGAPVEPHVVAHGKNSDPDYDGWATSFSNVNGSLKSSVGFYYVAEQYTGENGQSIRLDGLSPTNSNARERAIVIHGADYVEDGRSIQGRSWGCPALSRADILGVIAKLKSGSIMYAMN